MAKKRKSSAAVLVILVIAIAVLFGENILEEPKSSKPVTTYKKSEERKTSPTARPAGDYEIFENCTLVKNRRNDGDSFLVKLPDGREKTFRLSYVDCPESAFKSYRNGENNHRRIEEQADYFGISSDDAVDIGKKAKLWVNAELGRAPFTVYTTWNSPFKDQRYHAFIKVTQKGKSRFIHERLIEKGYARIYTRGADLPDGTSVRNQRSELFKLQRSAKKNGAGGWSKSL